MVFKTLNNVSKRRPLKAYCMNWFADGDIIPNFFCTPSNLGTRIHRESYIYFRY